MIRISTAESNKCHKDGGTNGIDSDNVNQSDVCSLDNLNTSVERSIEKCFNQLTDTPGSSQYAMSCPVSCSYNFQYLFLIFLVQFVKRYNRSALKTTVTIQIPTIYQQVPLLTVPTNGLFQSHSNQNQLKTKFQSF